MYCVELFIIGIFLTICISGSPADMKAVLGACLSGFILGCFMFGEDKQLHSRIFFVFAILGCIMLLVFSGYGFYSKDKSKILDPMVQDKDKIMMTYFTEAQTYSNLSKDFTS